MKTKRRAKCPKTAFSLLELITAVSIMAVLMASVSVLVRTCYESWTIHEQDMIRTENAYGLVRQLVRTIRQANSVTAISSAVDTSGSLSVQNENGDILVWDHNDSTDEVKFGVSTASDLLAQYIDELTFIGYEKDGVTTTTTVGDIQTVECIVKTVLPHGAGESRTYSSQAWVRQW